MTSIKKITLGLLLLLIAGKGLALNLNSQQEDKSLKLADAALECGIYYEFTAGGLAKNPNVSRGVVQTITQNSKTLLHTADLLYHAAGISIEDRRKKVMQGAEERLQKRKENPGSYNALIYEYGEKCKLLMDTYSYRIENLSGKPESI